MGEEIWIGLKSVPCLWYGKLGSGVVKQKVTWVCADPQPSQSRDHLPPFQVPARNGSGVEIDSKCRDQHQDPADASIVHRSSRFVFLISPLPAGHPDCRQPTPRGISFLFLNRGRPIWGSDLQQHPTSSLHRKRQAQDKSTSRGLPVLTLDRSARRRLLDCSLA